MKPNQKIKKSEEGWRESLTPEQFHVLRKKGTELPFTGEYDQHFEKGVYICAACGNRLFASDEKFDAGCGWPSFYAPASKKNVAEKEDNSHLMQRTEVVCNRCGGHLGHVFNDGPAPTGLRYCINSAALDFKKQDKKPNKK